MYTILPQETEWLAKEVIGDRIAVHRELGAGLLEKIYETALCIECEDRGISFERQKRVRVEYKGRFSGYYAIDLVVENRIVLELKCVQSLEAVHRAQLLSYLKLTGMRLGLLMNFKVPVLKQGIKRVIL